MNRTPTAAVHGMTPEEKLIEHSCYPNLEQKLFPIIVTFAPNFCGSLTCGMEWVI
jgi:hypothetical protein